MATTPPQYRDGNPELRLQASELLARYPEIDDNEVAFLRDFYANASAVDTALLTCDPLLLPKINQFTADHGKTIRHKANLNLLLSVTFFLIVLLGYAVWKGI